MLSIDPLAQDINHSQDDDKNRQKHSDARPAANKNAPGQTRAVVTAGPTHQGKTKQEKQAAMQECCSPEKSSSGFFQPDTRYGQNNTKAGRYDERQSKRIKPPNSKNAGDHQGKKQQY